MNFPVTTSVAYSCGDDLAVATIELTEIGIELGELADDREMALRMPAATEWLAEIREQQRTLHARATQLRRQLTPRADTTNNPPGRHP